MAQGKHFSPTPASRSCPRPPPPGRHRYLLRKHRTGRGIYLPRIRHIHHLLPQCPSVQRRYLLRPRSPRRHKTLPYLGDFYGYPHPVAPGHMPLLLHRQLVPLLPRHSGVEEQEDVTGSIHQCSTHPRILQQGTIQHRQIITVPRLLQQDLCWVGDVVHHRPIR